MGGDGSEEGWDRGLRGTNYVQNKKLQEYNIQHRECGQYYIVTLAGI